MDNSQYIRNTKAAMKIAYRVKTGKTAKDTVHLPVSMDIPRGCITWNVHGNGPRCIHGGSSCIYIVSEYLYTGDGTHTLMSADVQFEIQDGTVYRL